MRSLVLGASLGSIAVVGMPMAASAQGATAESCAFALKLRSASSVERMLENFPNDPCVPLMLGALPLRVLSRLSTQLIADLPRAQLRLVPRRVLQQLGLDPALGGAERTIGPRTPLGPSTTIESQY